MKDLCGVGNTPLHVNNNSGVQTLGNTRREDKVTVNNLTKMFGKLLVLNEISFSVGEGEFLCIVGPTGCGKTTFLNLLSKLMPSI